MSYEDRLISAETIDKPSQKEIDFSTSSSDEELLNEYRLIQETSRRMNEHGIGEWMSNNRSS